MSLKSIKSSLNHIPPIDFNPSTNNVNSPKLKPTEFLMVSNTLPKSTVTVKSPLLSRPSMKSLDNALYKHSNSIKSTNPNNKGISLPRLELPVEKQIRAKSFFDSKLPSLKDVELNTDRSNGKNSNSKAIQISKHDLTAMLKDIRQEILQETVKHDDFMSNVATKHQYIDDKLAFTKEEIKDMLKAYKSKIKQEITQDKETTQTQQNTYYQEYYNTYQQYSNFQSILWYYYIYNPELYKQLIDEYNHRLHNQLLGSLGLTEKFANKSDISKPIDPGSAVKFNVGELNSMESLASPKGKSNIRKSLFIGQNPDLLTSVISPQNSRKSMYIPENLNNVSGSKKSIYIEPNSPSHKRKTTLMNAAKLSMMVGQEAMGDDDDVKNQLKRVRKKSVMPPRDQRELLRKQDESDEETKKKLKRNTKYVPVLPIDLFNNDKTQRKSLFPNQKHMNSLHNNQISKEKDLKNSVASSNNSSDYDIYGNNDRKISMQTPGLPLKGPKKSNIEERDIIVERYGIAIKRTEYEMLKQNDIMSEGLMSFFMNYLQEKQNFLSQSKLASNNLRILYYPIKFYETLKRKSLANIDTLNDHMLPKGNSFDNYDKLLYPLHPAESTCFIVAEISMKIIRIYEVFEANDAKSSNNEVLVNIKKYLQSSIAGEWKIEHGTIDKIEERNSVPLYICKSIYLISQGIGELSNRAKKTYEFKQKFLNLLIKVSRVLDNHGDIKDFNALDL